MSDWYIHRDDERYGPYSTKQLRSFAAEGRLQPDDKVWKDSFEKPVRARHVIGLFATSSIGDSPESYSIDSNLPDEIPQIQKSRFSDTSAKAKAAFGQAMDVAGKALTTGTEHLRATFGAAVKDTVSIGIRSLGEVLARPTQYAFGTLVLLIGCALSVPGLVTILLTPVFIIGYVSYIESILKREPAGLGKFISFMRHGWDSLWHLLMLLGSFVIAAAIAIAPVVIVGVIIYTTVGTLSLGGLQIMNLLPTGLPDAREGVVREDMELDRGPHRIPNAEKRNADGFMAHVLGAMDALMENTVWIASLLVTGLILTVLLMPSGSILILVYCTTLMVATRDTESGGTYDLVYEAFERMLLIATSRWKLLLASGVLLVGLPIAWIIVAAIVSSLLMELGLMFVSAWIYVVLTPLMVFGFVIYVNVFTVKTAMQLVELQSAT